MAHPPCGWSIGGLRQPDGARYRNSADFHDKTLVVREEGRIMPQLIAIALAGAGLLAGARWFARTAAAAVAEAERRREQAEREAAGWAQEPRDLGTLEFDSRSGVYRPRRPN
jgi:hypothetical protein